MSRRASGQLVHLSSILSKMKVVKSKAYLKKTANFGNSSLFNYATNKNFDQSELKSQQLGIWNKLEQHDKDNSSLKILPINGFQEMIQLTEEGKLWHYPVDNEQGMDREKTVPFEDHVFLDHLLDGFPENEYVQAVMQYVVAGLGRNHWITVERKHEIIKFYKNYFEEKKDTYKTAGFEL